MYTLIGITGQVGGAVARTLLKAKQQVRAVVRSAEKGEAWKKLGCEVVLGDVDDTASLTEAFQGAEGTFVMLPPLFDPSPGFPEAHKTIASIRDALAAARPGRVVGLSTIGAQVQRANLLNQLRDLETSLGTLDLPITFLRPGWFMENFLWDVAAARETGIIPSFLQPLDQRFPMVATEDVGSTAAELLMAASPAGVVELEGPERVSANDVAAAFSRVLCKPVTAQPVPRERWEATFRSHGMKNPEPRLQMLDGFNARWIDYEGGEDHTVKGTTSIQEAVQLLVERIPAK